MKKIPVLFLTAFFLFSSLGGCYYKRTIRGDGEEITVSSYLSDYREGDAYSLIIRDILVDTPHAPVPEIELTPAREDPGTGVPACFAEITADRNIIETLQIIVDDQAKTITVAGEPGARYRAGHMLIRIGAPLRTVEVQGAFAFGECALTGPSVELRIRGAVSGLVRVEADQFRISLEGAASITAEGKARDCTIQASGACLYNGYDLFCEEVELTLNGAGKCHVNASEKLTATLRGAGAVYYDGDPPIVEKFAAGLAKIAPRS